MDQDEGSMTPRRKSEGWTWDKQHNRCSISGAYREGVIQAMEPPRLSGVILEHKACHVENMKINEKSRNAKKPGGHTRIVETPDLPIQNDR